MGVMLRLVALPLFGTAFFLVVCLPARSVGADGRSEAVDATRRASRALEAGRVEQAIALLEAVLHAFPDAEGARKNLALALSRQTSVVLRRRDGAAALALIDRALGMHPGRLLYEKQRAQALFHAGRGGEALRLAQDLVERSPAFGGAWETLADVREREGELREALEALAVLQSLRPADASLRRRIAGLQRRADAEQAFLTHSSGHFVVRYDPNANPATVELALTLLEDAYARVTADLGLAPRTSAQVALYDGAEFRRVTGAHSWVGGLYQNGTLRLPIRNLERHRVTAARVLAHEFTHHVLRERVPALPTWWHEGIAQFVEDSGEASAERLRGVKRQMKLQKSSSKLLSLDQVRGLRITKVASTGTVRLYYAQALAFMGWLVERFGTGALPSFLTALGTRTDVDAASKQAFGSSLDALYASWIESL